MFGLLGVTMALIQGGFIRRRMAGKEQKLALLVSNVPFAELHASLLFYIHRCCVESTPAKEFPMFL